MQRCGCDKYFVKNYNIHEQSCKNIKNKNMNYYFDTEFIEGCQSTGMFRLEITPPTIDLISIAMVNEDGEKFYAVSKEFNLKEAWNRYELKHISECKTATYVGYPPEATFKDYWIRNNVLKPIFDEFNDLFVLAGGDKLKFTYRNLKMLLKLSGSTNEEIAKSILNFIYPSEYFARCKFVKEVSEISFEDWYSKKYNPKFYAYFADYDWVVFCWLFGKMINLPKGFPKYCIDLKQMLDEKVDSLKSSDFDKLFDSAKKELALQQDLSFEKKLNIIKNHHPDYPQQKHEHNALADALWNKKLHEFIKKL